MATPPVAPGVQDQSVGGFEDVRRMPAPPQPMQPRPSLVVGGPAFFTPEGYQAPVQPEQAFMPTDRRTDAIGDNFRRPYERPIMPMPSPTPPPEMAQPAPPRVPIEQPIKEPVIDPGPITTQPVMPMPVPTPQPEYDPFAYSDLGSRALGGEYINSMTFHWFDPTTGKGGSTTEGWSRVPDSAKPYTYLNKEEANEAKENFMTFEDRGDIDTTPKRTPVTTPAPAPAPQDPVSVGGPGKAFLPDTSVNPSDYNLTDMRARGPGERGMGAKLERMGFDIGTGSSPITQLAPKPAAPPVPMKPITLPGGQTVEIPDIDMEAVNASLIEAGIIPQIPQVAAPVPAPVPASVTAQMIPQVSVPQVSLPQPMAPQAMPSMPSLPSVTLPTLPTLGSRPSLTRSPMRGNPRER